MPPTITSAHATWQTEGELNSLALSWRELVYVQVDTVATSVGEVLNLAGSPQLGDPHPRFPDAHVKSIRPRRQRGLYLYEFEVEYSTEEEEETEDPLAEPFKFDYSDQVIQVPAQFDLDGFYLTPSTGLEMFDPLPTVDVFIEVMTIQRNVELWDTDRRHFLRPFRGAVNEDEFFGEPAGSVRCASITGSNDERHAIKFTRETYRFEIRQPILLGVQVVDGEDPPATSDILGWEDAFADLGSFYLDSSDNQIEFVTSKGAQRGTLGMLDGSGGQNTTGEPVYLRYKLKNKKVFADLDLGSS